MNLSHLCSVTGVALQWGNTPLTHTSSNGHLETVEVLLAHGADVKAKSNVSLVEGCEGAPMVTRRPWTGCRSSGLSERLGRGVKATFVRRKRYALVYDMRATKKLLIIYNR